MDELDGLGRELCCGALWFVCCWVPRETCCPCTISNDVKLKQKEAQMEMERARTIVFSENDEAVNAAMERAIQTAAAATNEQTGEMDRQ